MRKYYLYLIVFALAATLCNVSAYAQVDNNPGGYNTVGLKYSGQLSKNHRKLSSGRDQKRADLPLMKIDENKVLWAFLLFDQSEDYEMGLATFALTNPTAFQTIYPSEVDASAGACVLDKMYLQYYSFNHPVSFGWVDLLTGEEHELCTYERSDPLFRDMTYDYTSNTMYAIGSKPDAEDCFLYSIDLSTGTLDEICMLDYQFMTLASDNKGELYGISLEGDLYQIKPEEKSLNLIGHTNEYPCYLQSMDFDQGDNTLYWAGFTEEGESFLAIVDVKTGEATRVIDPLGEYAEVSALHVVAEIIAPGAPESVKELTVTPGENGALTADLSWINPATTVDGTPLKTLPKIDVYRNDVLIHTIDNPEVGKSMQWTDRPEQSGPVSYKLIATNEAGKGKAAKSEIVYVGRDLPVAVSEPVLAKSDESYSVQISWKAPIESINGGWFDADGLTYDVVRCPDQITVAQGLKVTSYTDESITDFNAYYYLIIPKTTDGAGVSAQTNKLFVGPAPDLPYSCNFSTEQQRNWWLIEDANRDGYTWMFGNHYKGTADWFLSYNIYDYESEPVLHADDWFFSAPFKFEAGRHYLLKFKVRLAGALAQEKFKTTLCSAACHDAVVKVIGDYTDLNDQNFQEVAAHFVVDETGEYHIGFQCYSDPNQWMVHITDISLEESFLKDMESTLIMGVTAPIQHEMTPYEVTVRNVGAENISAYRVEVVDEDLNILGGNTINQELPPQQSAVVEVKCTLPQLGNKRLQGRVVLEGDGDSGNNLSPALSVEVLSGENQSWEYIGSKAEMAYSPNYPFAADYRYGRSQTLYLPSDLKFASGTIKKLVYYYYITPVYGVAAQNVPIRVYMANTEVETLIDAYVPEDRFSKVFEGNVSLNPQNNVLQIDLDVPFEYTGKNLCIFTELTGRDETTYKGNNFLYTTDTNEVGSGRTRYYWSGEEFDPLNNGEVSDRMPNVSLLVEGKKLTSLCGSVKEERILISPNPVSDRLYITGEYTRAELFSVSGASVKVIGEPLPEIDMTGLAEGIYFLKLNTEENVETHKIVVK